MGYDADWIHTSADRRVASYTGLSPGDYRLQVRATNHSGIWSQHELDLPVSVQPDWWESPWARIGAAATALALLWSLLQWRTRHLRRRGMTLQQLVADRTAGLERLTEALRESSLTDPLTGLRNRRFLTDCIGQDLGLVLRRHDDALRDGRPAGDDDDLIVFLVDVDHFKAINDTLGHGAGDEVLVQLAGRLRCAIAEPDIVLADGHQWRVTVSIGFACYPVDPRLPYAFEWSETLELADAALYDTKGRGRNGWAGVVDAGQVEATALSQRPSASAWLGSGAGTVLRSRGAESSPAAAGGLSPEPRQPAVEQDQAPGTGSGLHPSRP